MQTIALIGAMQPEIELLRAGLSDCREQKYGAFTLYRGGFAGKNVLLALSGIGKVNAALTTALLLQHRPDCVINTGSAGGLGQNLRVGDVVIGTQTAHHDADVTAFGYAIGQLPQLPARFESDAALCRAAVQSAGAFADAQVHSGLIVSGDQFIHDKHKVAQLRTQFPDALAVEMEAAAIAQSCHQFGIPFVVIRALSDLADDAASISFETFLQQASVHSAKMVQNVLQSI